VSGFIGILELDGAPVDRHLLGRLTAFHSFRGPDGSAVWCDGPVGLGHSLWKPGGDPLIVSQPLELDGRLWVVTDARLDARQGLVDSLLAAGCDVGPGTPDASLLLHSYAAWGEDCVDHLLGDFAFALWDAPRQRLFCAVDHWGVQALYYARLGDTLVFGNTLHALRLHPRVSGRLNEIAVGDCLLWGIVNDRETTIDADILRLPPATALSASDRGVRLRRYWELPESEELRLSRPQDYLDTFSHLLSEAVSDRLRGPRAAVSLSGGIDSPLVADSARRVLGARGGPWDLKGFTAVLDTLIPDREREFATLAARCLGLELEVLAADGAKLFDWVTLDWMAPEPCNDPFWAFYRTWHREIAAAFPVILTGWDGDALLEASLPTHWRNLLRRRGLAPVLREMILDAFTHHRLPPVGFRTALKRWMGASRSPGLPSWLDAGFVRRTGLAERREKPQDAVNGRSPRAAVRRNLARPTWEIAFRYYDSGQMGFPSQGCHPLMDVRLVTFLARLPAAPWCAEKQLFRMYLRGAVPERVRRRPKTPLAGDPVRVTVKSRGIPEFARLRPETEVATFVDVARLPPIEAVWDSADFWPFLNILNLDLWLRKRREEGAWNRLPEDSG
jgi:asparagine synthase (glutamine-hydrolysing)